LNQQHEQQEWSFKIRGKAVTVRVVLDGKGGATVMRYSVADGVAQALPDIQVGSQAEAKDLVERKLLDLLGATWPD